MHCTYRSANVAPIRSGLLYYVPYTAINKIIICLFKLRAPSKRGWVTTYTESIYTDFNSM